MATPVPEAAPLLAIADSPAALAALQQALQAAGLAVQAVAGTATACLAMVQAPGRAAPQQVIAYLPGGADADPALAGALREALPGLAASLVIGPDAAAWGAAGADAWAPTLDAADLPGLTAFAAAAGARRREMAAELQRVRTELDERKWVDRAKGLLMAARGIAEDDAFRLLRNAAMHANLRLAEVSRSVLDAARWAEAVNRAGQLRMLSQRAVAVAAQRCAGVDPSAAREQGRLALRRLRENLEHLQGQLQGAADEGSDAGAAGARAAHALADALAQARQAGRRLDEALAPLLRGRGALPPDAPAALAAADAAAEALLEAAQRLTAAVALRGARPALSLVDLCGSQRMRVQRLVKDALLARLLAAAGLGDAAARLVATMNDYDAAMQRIVAAPLSAPDFREALAQAQAGWLALLHTVRQGDEAALVHAGEQQLAALDRLTERCEHSLQVLMA